MSAQGATWLDEAIEAAARAIHGGDDRSWALNGTHSVEAENARRSARAAFTAALPIIREGIEGEHPSNVGPYPIGSPEFKIWQDGHHNGWKSERRMWQQMTGVKYPQDVHGLIAGAVARGVQP